MFQNTVLKSINLEEVMLGRTSTIFAILKKKKLIPLVTNPQFITKQLPVSLTSAYEDLWMYSLVGFNLESSTRGILRKRGLTVHCLGPLSSLKVGNKFLDCIMLLYLVLVEEKYKPEKATATH